MHVTRRHFCSDGGITVGCIYSSVTPKIKNIFKMGFSTHSRESIKGISKRYYAIVEYKSAFISSQTSFIMVTITHIVE